jgi:hypothetical protein
MIEPLTELQKAFKLLHDRQLLLDDANQLIIELQDENDRLHCALQEKDKALLSIKEFADEISKKALLTTSIDADSDCLIGKDVTSFHNLMLAFGVEGYAKKAKKKKKHD